MIMLTTEQAQQIEESLDELYAELAADSHRDGPRCLMLTTAEKALDTIRAARAQEQPHPDDEAVDRFAAAMKAKLEKKRAEGRGGWEDKNQCSAEFLNRLLNEHVGKGDPVDVGNLAMMLWNRGERTEVVREQVQAEHEPVGDVKALDYAILTLHSIACLTQSDNLLWWQERARSALARIDELLGVRPVAIYQEPASRAILCPPAPPEVYKMRSRDAFEAGWWEAQRQKAVSPISPVQQAKQEPVAVVDANDDGYWADILPDRSVKVGQKLYAAPVHAKDLTDVEILSIPYLGTGELKTSMVNFARAVIAADREKNKC